MPPETEQATDQTQTIEPHVLQIMKGLGKSIEDISPTEEAAMRPIDADAPLMMPEPIGTHRDAAKGTLKMAVTADEVAADEAAEKAAADKKSADDKAAADKATADSDAAVAAAEAAKKKPAITLVKREPTPQTQPATPPKKEPTADELAATEKQNADAEYEKTLTSKEKRMIEVARYAETKGKKGLAEATLKYLRDTEKFLEDHPDTGQDSEEFDKFLKDNNPFKDDDFQELAADMREDRAYQRARADVTKEFEPTRREVRELQLQPVIARAVASVTSELVAADPADKDVMAFDKAVLDAIQQKGYQSAVEEFPLEAPIIQGTINATEAWLRLSSGAKLLDENNVTDAWVMRFVSQESANMQRQPKDQQVRDGKTFLPMGDYIKQYGDYHKPSKDHWTFDDDMVVGMIAASGKLAYTGEIKRLERSGFKRAPKITEAKNAEAVKKTDEAGDTEEHGSPRAGGKTMTGTGEQSGNETSFETEFPHLRGLAKLRES